jgi:uncharacterized membrane protein YbhN (UPF0104 family)
LALVAGQAGRGAAFSYILLRQSWSELRAALSGLSALTLAMAMLLMVFTLVLGTLRWRLLMSAYGATQRPPFARMLRVYFVGQFYNTYVPGGVGGDVLRGVVTRSSFPDGGATAAVAIVFVERALGLLGIAMVAALAAPFDTQGRLGRAFLPYCALGVLAVVGLVVAIAHAHRVAHFTPARVATILRSLPTLQRLGPFFAAIVLSILNQMTVATCGHVLVSSVYAPATLGISFLAMPLAAGAGFFPLSIAGAGPRDAVLVALYEALGVPRAAGVAAALGFLFSILIVAGLGGILQLLAPLSEAQKSQP